MLFFYKMAYSISESDNKCSENYDFYERGTFTLTEFTAT